jgi:simple sugar transport system substrate-binding protein
MKKLSVLFSVLLILSFVISACAPKATPTPEAATKAAPPAEVKTEQVATEKVATEEVATEAVMTEAVVTEAPAVTEGAAPAAAAGWCSGTKIVFFPGGTPGGPFETVVYNGAVQAASDTGANVEYVWSDWNPEKMISQFSEAMATNPDGIAIMGHPGTEAFAPLVDEAESKGIVVTSMNVQLADLQAKYGGNGFGYAGALQYQAGYALGKEALARSGLASGDKAFVWGLMAQAGRGERTKGIVDALKEGGIDVIYQEIDDATNKDPAAGVPVFVGVMSANPDIKMIVTDHGNLTGTQRTYLESAGLGPDSVFAAGFDLSVATVEAIREGWTDLVSDQQQFLQGYFGVLQICLSKNYAFSGLQIDTGAGFAHKDNVELLAGLVEKQIR